MRGRILEWRIMLDSVDGWVKNKSCVSSCPIPVGSAEPKNPAVGTLSDHSQIIHCPSAPLRATRDGKRFRSQIGRLCELSLDLSRWLARFFVGSDVINVQQFWMSWQLPL